MRRSVARVILKRYIKVGALARELHTASLNHRALILASDLGAAGR